MPEVMSPPHIGRVALSVRDLDRSIRYYTEKIGLTLLEYVGDIASLGVRDRSLLHLHGQPGAAPVRRATGLYHFALLLPSRAALGDALHHYYQNDAAISGFADHAVSEAIYLTDPDGHGIEVYRDRPRTEWSYPGGQLKMVTEPFDFEGVLRARDGVWRGLPPDTIMGHVHLQVAEIAATEAFYVERLGLDRVLRFGPAATFLAANGYHHHIGANTWAGAGLAPAPEDAARLLWYEIRQPDNAALDDIGARLTAAGYPFERVTGELQLVDPSGIRLRLTTGQS